MRPRPLPHFTRTAIFRLFLIFAGSLSACAGSAAGEDDSNAHPALAASDLAIIRGAERILDSSARWNRKDDRVLHPGATMFSLYTAIEKASLELTGSFAHREGVMQEARFAIEEVAPHKGYTHRLMGFNNDPTTSCADIKRVLALTESHIRQKLSEKGGAK